jgi:DNA-binding cell septation regulator SpoVG
MENQTPSITISEIQLVPIRPHNGVVAFASFVLNGVFFVNDIRIVTKLNEPGYRLSYPFKILGTSGRRIYICNPLNRETEEYISKQVLAKYEELLEKGSQKERRP